jgi:hypothetical protein
MYYTFLFSINKTTFQLKIHKNMNLKQHLISIKYQGHYQLFSNTNQVLKYLE